MKPLLSLQRFAEDNPAPDNEPKTYTQEELDAALAKAKAENDKLFNEKWDKKFARYKEEEQKRIDEAKRLAEMSAQERAEAERDALQRELDELKAANTLAEMKSEARKILKEAETPISDEVLEVLVTRDAEKTKAAITAYSDAFKKAVEDAVKDALKGKAPSASTGNKGITKEDILKIESRAERQKAINENIELFT